MMIFVLHFALSDNSLLDTKDNMSNYVVNIDRTRKQQEDKAALNNKKTNRGAGKRKRDKTKSNGTSREHTDDSEDVQETGRKKRKTQRHTEVAERKGIGQKQIEPWDAARHADS